MKPMIGLAEQKFNGIANNTARSCRARERERQANLVLIAYASSESSGEPAHPRSLARTFAARSYKQRVKGNLQTESQIPGLSEWLACAVKICHDGMLEDTNSLDAPQRERER